jgi:phospholipid/cholesterol/gamma-HCH transport system permease protein
MTTWPKAEPERARAFGIEHVETGVALEVRLEGKLALADAAALWHEIRSRVDPSTREEVVFDLSKVESIDGGAMALLVQTKWDLEMSGGRCEITGGSGAVQKIVDLYQSHAPADRRPPAKARSAIEQIGNATYEALLEVQLVLAFLGSMVLEVGGVIRRPRTANWREVASIMNRTGADAVPIVVLINFLIGFVMAFQSAVQLKQFGANIYVADLVGLSITRELGPLMTAIIVCGRSGAAFAAELGTMKVSEEVDALRTMGFGPLRFLVFPRILGLFLVMPILTLLGDLVGMLGGLLVGVTSLDLTITGYLTETRGALRVWDIFQGLIKCGVFAIAIGIVSCQQGLSTSGGAEGVGRRTTASVVTALFALILVDAAFTLLFHALHL